MTRLAARSRVARTLRHGGALVLALGLAACGSQLDPDQVAGASGGTGGDRPGRRGRPRRRDAGRPDHAAAPAPATPPAAARPTGGGGTTTGGGTHRRRRRSGGGTPAVAPASGWRRRCDGGGDNAADGGGGTRPAATASRTVPGSPTPRSPSATPPTSPARCPASSSPARTRSRPTSPTSTPPATSAAASSSWSTYDSRTDAGADQQATTPRAATRTFAMVGSMSAFDSGGAATAQSCGLPDIRSAAVTKDRNACTTCFPAQSVNTGEWENAPGEFIKANYPDAAAHAAVLYINAGAAAENGPVEAAAMTKQGLHFDVVQGIDVAEFNYAPYAQQLKDKGVKVGLLGRRLPAVRAAGPGDAADRLQARHLPARPHRLHPRLRRAPAATPSTAPSSSSTSCRSRRPAPTRRCSST